MAIDKPPDARIQRVRYDTEHDCKEHHMAGYTMGNYLATRPEQIGLKHYFMVPGDCNLVLLDQHLGNKNMQQTGCRNELNGAYAAEAYARVNGCGAIVTTFNVGAFSALNGVADAYAERLPVIFISSGVTLMPNVLPAQLAAFVAHVVRISQKHGIARSGYAGTTLCDHVGLPRPATPGGS